MLGSATSANKYSRYCITSKLPHSPFDMLRNRGDILNAYASAA
jgi:hypothetical protein